jgi:hypothetical protein
MDNDTDFSWFQFYSFVPNIICQISENEIFGTIYIDISCGHSLRITISNQDHLTNYPDDSNLFRCRITGPADLLTYSTGRGKVINNIPHITLYHHTLPAIVDLINGSLNYRGSLWNYQGTKKLENINYAYFTSLDVINKQSDLRMIAMSTNGEIILRKDLSDEVITIPVYRESTSNRTATLQQFIDSTLILNNHLWRHRDEYGIHYEICGAFIYRIGLVPNSPLPFKDNIITRVHNIKTTGYIVLGDATRESGLLAPYDEENTKYIFKIEPFHHNSNNILNFWIQNANTDLFNGINIEMQIFAPH